MVEPKLIVGLGNPGDEYEYSRHNLGFLVVRQLAGKYGLSFKKNFTLKGLLAQGAADSILGTLYLLLPLTYVNNSGAAVKEIIQKKNIALHNILVVCDDVNLEFGQLRFRLQGSHGGHNGLNSVINHLKTKEFMRLRLGVGYPARKDDMVSFVLGEFNQQEKKQLDAFLSKAADGCALWLKEGIAKAMDQFNKKEKR